LHFPICRRRRRRARVVCPDDRLPPARPDPEPFQDRLLREHGIEALVARFDGRAVLRVSVLGYETAEDLGALVSLLEG